MVVLSWMIFTWLFNAGELDRAHDNKEISSNLKAMKEAFKKTPRKQRRKSFVMNKWMFFGSGFYGLAGLWTFAVIEVSQFLSFVFNYPGTDYLMRNGFVAFLIEVLINQLQNLIMALVWFFWWDTSSMLLWVGIAYLGFWAGVAMARRQQESALLQHAGKWRIRLDSKRAGRFTARLRKLIAPVLARKDSGKGDG